MLEFKQIEGSGPPMDIEVTTDDADGEMASITECFEEGEFEDDNFRATTNLREATRGEDDRFHFVIPGGEVGEIADFWDGLADFIEGCNLKAVEAAEKAAEAEAS